MSNQLEKLKSSIKKEYVDKFEYDLMKTSGFIPVDKRQNNFYVILNKQNSQNKNSITESVRAAIGDVVIQFIPLETNDFENVFGNLNISEQFPDASSVDKKTDAKKSHICL